MADPVLRPLKWNKEFHIYAEQNGLFDVLMELFRELCMWKPHDPLAYIRDELPRIGKSIYAPRVFILGEHPALEIGRNIAESTGALFITLEDIVSTAPETIRLHLATVVNAKGEPDMCLSSLLVAAINRRIAMTDCMNCGYVLHGFPRSKTEAMNAQQNGLLPRQVFILLPEFIDEGKGKKNNKKLRGSLKPPSDTTIEGKRNYLAMKDIGSAYSPEVCRVIPYDRWMTTKQSDLEAEFLGQIIARKPAGAPWIPKILIMGPPGSGKTVVAEHLADKFNVVRLDWMELVRGVSKLKTPIGEECRAYLESLSPLTDETVKTILDDKVSRDDCQKKGFVLEGFPENVSHARIMEDMSLTPNRVLLVSVTEADAQMRMAKKRDAIYARWLPFLGKMSSTTVAYEESQTNMYLNPHTEYAVKQRYDQFNRQLDELVNFYGARILYIDGTQPVNLVKEFAEASVIRPPTLRF